jgi:2-polyprenyl-3-methyl-5-hydroxy-6-metoxy-1,4-benzoquinol methylase
MICRLCQNDNLLLYYTQGCNNQFKFYKCSNCNLVNYDLSAGINQEKYAEIYIDPFDEKCKKNRGQNQSWFFIRKHIAKRGKLLDIGCGNGRLLYLAKENGFQVKGIEISPSLAESVSNKLAIEVTAGDFFNYDSSNERFDLIVLRHVLEHLPDPVIALRKIHSLLNEDGYALLEFPNIRSFNFELKRLFNKAGLSKKKYKPDYKPGHYNEFSRKSFQYLTFMTGFQILCWQTYSYHSISNFIYHYLKVGNKIRTIIKKKF